MSFIRQTCDGRTIIDDCITGEVRFIAPSGEVRTLMLQRTIEGPVITVTPEPSLLTFLILCVIGIVWAVKVNRKEHS